jgi:hypothetical protein
MLVAHVRKRRGYAIDERLGADEAVIGKHVSTVREMLARAKPNLEMEGAIVTEQAAGTDLAVGGDFDLREEVVDEFLLTFAQLVTAGPSVETVQGQGIAGLVCRHAGAPSRWASGSSREPRERFGVESTVEEKES